MIKGLQHWIFLDNGPFASEWVPAFRFRHVLVLWFHHGGGGGVCVVGGEKRGVLSWVHLEVKVPSFLQTRAA